VACGEIGLAIDYLYSLTPCQFYNTLKGYRDKEEKALRLSLVLTRRLSFHVLQPYSKQLKKETDLYLFDWEKDAATALTEAEMHEIEAEHEKIKERWAQYDAARAKRIAEGGAAAKTSLADVLAKL
jgi:hypothetical protein